MQQQTKNHKKPKKLHQIIYDYLILYTHTYCKDARDLDIIVSCFVFGFFGFLVFQVLLWFLVCCCQLRWSRGSVLAFSTQVRGFKPGRSRRIFKGEKILSTTSFGGEVKPSVSCRRFAACKRSLNGVEVVISAKLPDNILAHSSTFRRQDLLRRDGRGDTWWRKVGTSKRGGKQWQTTPKNLPKMQRTRAIPVT